MASVRRALAGSDGPGSKPGTHRSSWESEVRTLRHHRVGGERIREESHAPWVSQVLQGITGAAGQAKTCTNQSRAGRIRLQRQEDEADLGREERMTPGRGNGEGEGGRLCQAQPQSP